ncbi:MAG TPA: hypothetical protein DD438_04830 [Verrucomicrobiales bacterium]|nr:hypothetical protein [Verrucomicrobiales bacterium]HCQ38112.1 hypothetical protein [Verrucomicrobiales bacterium]
MAKSTDIRCAGAELYFLPVETRVPLKFGSETLTSVTCARVRVRVEGRSGDWAEGWGETPLSVTWVWPSELAYELRHEAMRAFCVVLAKAWSGFNEMGHPLEIGHDFMEGELPQLLQAFNESRGEASMPWLAALVCCSLFDIAVHDAYGNLHGLNIYGAYGEEFMSRDLSAFLSASPGNVRSFQNAFPADFLRKPASSLPAWHLVGGLDPVGSDELSGKEPDDGYPVELSDWISRDGLKCLKIKLRGNDSQWDYERLAKVGKLARAGGVDSLSADFNCMVTDPEYVTEILKRLEAEQPLTFRMLIYVEQPFPYDLERHPIEVGTVSECKPLFLDESAHDWKLVKMGRDLGWTGVALKTCKTQTGALLSGCWAEAHGMQLMVQDLTNPMLAQIPHVLLAAYVNTIRGVESNSMQFYPDASRLEERVHPGLYRRRNGMLSLESIKGSGFGYRQNEIDRPLPEPVVQH